MCMKNMVWIVILIGCVIGYTGNVGWSGEKAFSDEKKVQFPTSQEDIIRLLGVAPPKVTSSANDRESLFGGTTMGNARGLAGIAEDEQALVEAPKVGALILFDYNSDQIKMDSLPLLQEFAKAFQHEALKDAVFVVAGHTDSKGSEVYNLNLSKRRAEAIKTFLVAQYQIDSNRLFIKPYGERKPLESNDTDAGRAQNRRVEFIRIQ